ncbi:MAG: histidine phosphatase family protein [Bacteroidia bacterium]
MQNIFIIRHGETEYNRLGCVQGSGIDTSLNEKGRQQAEAFYNHYSHIPFSRIYVSSLLRSQESVKSFAGHNIITERHPGLNEISWGTFEGRHISNLHKTYYEELVIKWQKGETHHGIEGGESPDDVAKRQRKVIDLIMQREDDENVLVCMHGRAMRIFLCQLLQLPLQNMSQFRHHNLGLYQVTISPDGRRTLARENCIAHLNQILVNAEE